MTFRAPPCTSANRLLQTLRSGRFTPAKEHLCALDRNSGSLDATRRYLWLMNCIKETDTNTQIRQNVSLHIWYLHYRQHFHDNNGRCEHSHFCRHTTARSSPVWDRIPSGKWYQALLPQVVVLPRDIITVHTVQTSGIRHQTSDICSRPLEWK